MKKERRLITSALPYTNNVPHIGNIVGSHFPADIYARYCRLMGHDTVFIGGTDEHGTASEIAAQKYGITPKELCDFFYKIHKEIYDWFEISYDNFSRTSKPIHYETTQEFLNTVYKNGYIIEKTIMLPFCNHCQRQLSDRFIEGTCPECGYDKARGDQCESCSTLLDPIKLKNPKCAVCGLSDIEFKEKRHLFLDLEKLSNPLKKWIKGSKVWRQQVKSLAMGWIDDGLKPRCITRNLKWGVPVPFKGFEDLVYYVWVDAPIGYISSTKEWNIKRWREFWQKKGSKIYHFIGKDNIPFHTIFFPGMLMANGKYNLPYNVVGLQYLNYENGKFSKSQNRGVFCENLPNAGLDAEYWRFYLSYLIPELRDTEFLWKEFQDRVNTELVGNFGNFVNRTLSFVQSKYNSIIPKPKLRPKDKKFIAQVQKEIKNYLKSMEEVRIREGLENLLKISAMGNKYFQDNEPWKDIEKGKSTIFVCTNMCLTLGLLISPFLPRASERILKMLDIKKNNWKGIDKFSLKGGEKIGTPELLFRKIEGKQIEELKQKTSKVTEYFKEKIIRADAPVSKGPVEERSMVKKESAPKPKEEKPAAVQELKTCKACNHVPFEEFEKLDIRVAKIVKIEPHPSADRLYILLVDLGPGENQRQIVAGIRKYYKMEELLGRKIVMITNLQPALIRGIESNGMLLAAVDKDNDNVCLLAPERDMKEGTKVS